MGRPRTLLATSVLLTLVAAGCTSGPDGESAKDAADSLAAGLTSGKLAGTPFAGGTGAAAQRWLRKATAGMQGSTRAVSVAKVAESDGGKATATLHWSWDLARTDATWAYDVPATLTRGTDGHWATALQPTLLASGLKPGDHLLLSSKLAERADILGAHGAHLVTGRPVLRLGIDRTRVPAAAAQDSARRLARLLGVDAAAFAARVKAAGQQAFVEALVLRESDVSPAVRAGYRRIKGAIAVPDTLSLAPTREFARPVLGSVGAVTAEIVKASKGVYRAGDDAGLSGLEQRYDEQLRGTPGVAVLAVPRGRADARELFSTRPTQGRPLRTTIDPRLQQLAEKVLSGVGPASALVAIRPSDGDLLAVASGPGSQGYSTATIGRYAPGSTFKIVSSLALLRSGLTPASTLSCTPKIVVDGKTFKNYSDYPSSGIGRIPLRTAVADSCNTAFISQHDRVSAGDVVDAAAALGLGVDHDLGFPVFLGSVPTSGSDTEHAASLIGQGTVLASPVAMATVAASVAAGRTVVPRLLPDQKVTDPAPDHPLTAAEAARLRELMRAVVTSGSGSFLAGLPGAPVLAKTGTAEFGDQQPPQTHAWMVAVHGDLAVAAFVDVGESGSHTAGPLLEAMLRNAS